MSLKYIYTTLYSRSFGSYSTSLLLFAVRIGLLLVLSNIEEFFYFHINGITVKLIVYEELPPSSCIFHAELHTAESSICSSFHGFCNANFVNFLCYPPLFYTVVRNRCFNANCRFHTVIDDSLIFNIQRLFVSLPTISA